MDPNQNFPASILSNRTGFDPFSPPTLMPSAPRVDTRYQTDIDLGGDVYPNMNKGFGMGGSATDRIRAFRKAYQESRDPLGTNPAVPQQPAPQFQRIDASPTRYLR
jgi:hypothetical protein